VNGHTALIRSFGTTGVLLALSLVLLAIVSAIVAFDRWPEGTGASAVERVAVEPVETQRVDSVVVRSRSRASVVRGAGLRSSGAFASASRSGGALPGGREIPTLASTGPPPPRVPFRPPGERDRPGGRALQNTNTGGGPPIPDEEPPPIQAAACGARDAVSAASPDAGQALSGACQPGRRGGDGPLSSTVAGVAEVPTQVLKLGR
jgi:hypothetical protein